MSRSTFAWAVFAVVAALALSLPGCGGGGEGAGGGTGTEPAPPVGPIPAAEFATVPPPTFNQVIAAFRTVTTANPALLNDEPALSRALFDEVRRTATTAQAGRARALAAGRRALFDLDSRLTLEEWKLVIRSPINSARVAPTIEVSARAAIERMPCEAHIGFADGKADALRHAYWSALMTRRAGAGFAELFATAHETGSNNSAAASAMDLHNNALGRALAQAYPAASDDELLQMLQQQAFTFVAAGASIAANTSSLVFIAEGARRPFDGVFSGTLTAPDTGTGEWTLELHMAQCDADLHGYYLAARAGEVVTRRYRGSLMSGGAVTLTVAEPFAFELTAGSAPCRDMQALLTGSERDLTGPWTSSSCLQGGMITLRR